MAETTSTPSAPVPDTGEAERAPAELKATRVESAPEPTKDRAKKNANGVEKRSSETTTTAPEDKKDSADASPDKPAASTESADAKKTEESAAPAEPEANGTPASAKKGGSKRKSTGGVPEHKAKLNRKKSQSRISKITQLNAKPGEYYLARLRSFPPWPAIICDEEILPQTLLSTRPVTAQRPDGTYREDYSDEGKRAVERTFPVMFLGTNEFAWIPNTDLSPLDTAACKDVSEKGKSKSLVAAYGVAAENHDLQHYKELLADHQLALQQEEEEREAQVAAKAAAKAERDAKKNKRKSMDIVDDVDMEDADEEAKKPKSSKKRKKDETEGEEKPAKTPKTTTKLKLTTPKTPSSEAGKKAASTSKSKQTASSKKSGKASDESGDSRPVSKEPEKKINQEEAKEKKEREVLFVRHRLQKGFISRDQPPKDEDMATMSGYLTKLENIPDLEVSIIRSTKIHKVLRMIIKLSSIPRDEEFQFRQRALGILSKWKSVLDTETATPVEDKEKEDKPKSNGVHQEGAKAEGKDEKEQESKQTKADASEPQDEPMPDAEATDKTEPSALAAGDSGEKPADGKAAVEKEGEKVEA